MGKPQAWAGPTCGRTIPNSAGGPAARRQPIRRQRTTDDGQLATDNGQRTTDTRTRSPKQPPLRERRDMSPLKNNATTDAHSAYRHVAPRHPATKRHRPGDPAHTERRDMSPALNVCNPCRVPHLPAMSRHDIPRPSDMEKWWLVDHQQTGTHDSGARSPVGHGTLRVKSGHLRGECRE